ncbi:NAD(P)-dependent alcohol dehydrogenase [Vallitalea guaymasensis]|uniref:NAD(P)-dependent alcohol dehydrogenase n=1 Tax=Vallitalea guaymasensis TaxID=1185412 RepID=A0A8J8SDQ5_9FIRM|nr:NAD(P)-dependent alcohol dehydrogenase [Vallitalea guaymasensis]QUH30716.1 NAD(P)-dependent alcohol dehydrogenase [Vallitalea guaymasensis]
MKNRAVYMQGTNNMVFKDVAVPELLPKDVLIKIDTVGICGSDVHYYQHGKIGDFVVNGDFILGHECAGEVVQVGSEVENLVVGDRVCLEPGKTCGKCEFCKEGKYNLCPDVEFFATPPYHGVLQNYVKHPEDMCFKLPDNVSNMEGALVEPLAVGLHAASIGDVKLGDTVVIFGTGCIGLVTLLSCKARGASNIIVVDVLENRLKMAEKLGATSVINAKETDVIKQVESLTDGKGANVVIDTAGAEITVKQTVDVVKRGGIIVLVGMTPNDEVSFNFMKLMGKEGEVRTIFRYRNLYPVAINAIASGSINVKQIVSHEYDFEHTKEAFDFVVNNASEVVKAVIKID